MDGGPIHVSLAIFLIGNRISWALPFLPIGPTTPSGLRIVVGESQMERTPSHLIHTLYKIIQSQEREKCSHELILIWTPPKQEKKPDLDYVQKILFLCGASLASTKNYCLNEQSNQWHIETKHCWKTTEYWLTTTVVGIRNSETQDSSERERERERSSGSLCSNFNNQTCIVNNFKRWACKSCGCTKSSFLK